MYHIKNPSAQPRCLSGSHSFTTEHFISHHSRRLSSNDIRGEERRFSPDPRRRNLSNGRSSPYQPVHSPNIINPSLDPRRQNREPIMPEFESIPFVESNESEGQQIRIPNNNGEKL